MKKTTYFLSLVFALFANTNNINAQTKIWGVGSGVGEADAQFSNAFVNSTTASGYSTTQWTALTVYESDGAVTPGNAYWVRNLNGISSGGYATGMAPLVSPSAVNGAALFDSDFMDNGGVTGNFGMGTSPGDHKGELISPRIDLTGNTNQQLAVTFYSYYRRFDITNYTISISTDDGASWVESVDIQVLQPVAVNADVEGSVTAIFNTATQGVANLTQCRIKFTFEGYYYYAFIDDITIEDILPNIPNLVISEIMFNPPEAGTDSLEFIEIYNNDAVAVDLTNYTLAGITYTFPSVTLNPGEFYVVAVNASAFNNVFGSMPDGVFTGGLSNGGEFVTIKDASGNLVDSVRYFTSAPWPTDPNGQGPSLVLCDVNADNNDGNNWNASVSGTGIIINGFEVKASPGVANFCCPILTGTDTQLACDSLVWIDGNTYYSNNTTATFTYVNGAGCDSVVTLDLTINASPLNQLLSASQNTFCTGGGSTTIDLTSSEVGVDYYLRNDANDMVVDGPVSGTGSGISLSTGNITSTTTFNVYAQSYTPTTINALEFTGNGGLKKINLGTNIWTDNFVGTNQITVESWVKRSSLGSLHTIISNYEGSYPLLFRIDGDKITMYVNSGTSVQSISSIPVGVWTHVAGTYDGANLKVYINGVLEGTQPFTSNFIGTTTELKIGGGLNNNTEYFLGDIADVRLWNVAKTQSEIAAGKNLILNGNEANLIANYQFTEGSGTTAANSATGNAYPGTLVNNPAWVSGPSVFNTPTCSNEMTQLVTVTVLPALTGNNNTTICATGSVVINGTTYDASNSTGTEVFTNVGANGCDSTVTVSLNVLSALVGTDNTTICAEESVVINGTTYNASNPTGTEVFTNIGANGCDSTVTVALNVLPALVGTDNTTICAEESLIINGTTYDAGNPTGTEVFTNVGANGCDSTVTVALNVLAAVDVTVDNSLMPILSANQVGATYQWVDCDNGNAPISGEMGQTFTATVNGNYAVEVTIGGCTETSSCETVTGVGVKEVANNTVSIYPNPTSGMVNINLGSNNTSVNYSITSIEGKVVETGKTSTNNIIVDLSKEGNGVYFIRINTESTSTVYKLIKQ